MSYRVFCMTLLCSTAAMAGPSDYVSLPNVEYGEREVDFKFGSARAAATATLGEASLGFGYGASEWWFTEFYLKYQRENPLGTRFDAIEWENKFQLTETGKYPLDVGLLIEFEAPRNRSEGYELRFGPLLQTEFGRWQWNGNLLFGRVYRSSDGAAHSTEIGYQWQTKYRWQPQFEWGLQGFGEMGRWNHWDSTAEQNHRLGPAVFGKLALGNRQTLRYNAAWLVGVSDAAPDHTFRLQVEYEF